MSNPFASYIPPDNPYFPLPADYPTLTENGQKQARLAAVCDHSNPIKFVFAWDLFRRLYLMNTEPGFFYHNFKPSPPFHYQALYDLGTYGRNILAAPRGTAKSVVIGTEVPLFLALTRPYYRIVLSTSTDKLVQGRFDLLMNQFEQNPFILEDFGLQKPKRGKAIWNHSHLRLLNGSKLEGFSIAGRKRGARPDLFLLDDPEYDPENATSSEMLRDKFETFLFKQALPMLEEGSCIFWVGTMINSRSYLYHACHGEDNRFALWNRRVLSAKWENPEAPGKTHLLWEEKLSDEYLKIREAELGSLAFGSEMMNNPKMGSDKVFVVNPLINEYTIDTDTYIDAPLQSTDVLTFHTIDQKTKETSKETEVAGEWFRKLYRFFTFDFAPGLQLYHDYSAIAAMGMDNNNCLWILDLWMGRARRTDLYKQIMTMGLRWEPKVIGVETVGAQSELGDALADYVQRYAKESDWIPRVFPVDYLNMKSPKSKADRIARLEWRFPAGKIKYPVQFRNKWPFNMLYAQTQDFTYDLTLLPHDDAIDAVAMSEYLIKSKGHIEVEESYSPSFADKIRNGNLTFQGLPLISGVPLGAIKGEILDALLEKSIKDRYIIKDGRLRCAPAKRIFK